MNDYAALPWYLRHGLFAAFFAMFGLAYHGIVVGALIFLASFGVTMACQIAIDGWDRKRW